MNELFSDRAEAAIKHDPALPVKPDQGKFQHHESPDRVYGLIQTDNFKLLLDSMDKRATSFERPLRETIEFSPFNQESEPLLYPFLVMEAKKSDGAGRKITELQTAFVLRRLLKLQLDLEVVTKEETMWHTGPLVWFLAHRGENWYVSAAFTEPIEHSGTQFVSQRHPPTSAVCLLNASRQLLTCGLEIFVTKVMHYSCFLSLIIFLIGLGISTDLLYWVH